MSEVFKSFVVGVKQNFTLFFISLAQRKIQAEFDKKG